MSTATRCPSTWSRTGCVTCKRRRKKCDQTRPACTNCEKRGLQCEGYPLQFVRQAVGSRRLNNKHRLSTDTTSRFPSVSLASSSSHASSQASCPESKSSPHRYHDSNNPADFTWLSIALGLTSTDDSPNAPEVATHPDITGPEITATTALGDEGAPAISSITTDISSAICGDDNLPGLEVQQLFPSGDSFLGDLLKDDDEVDPSLFYPLLLGGSSSQEPLETANTISDLVISDSTLPHHLSAFPNLSSHNFYYLQYLDERAATQILNVDSGPFNPLRRVILPRALNCAGVLNGICAVAACHQAQLMDPDSRIDQLAIAATFYLESITWLRYEVGDGIDASISGPISVDDATIITSLLLCKYEILRGSASYWRHHLVGLEMMLRRRGGIASLEIETGQYVASFLRYHRMITDISHCEPSFPGQGDDDLDGTASINSSLDAYSGCAHHFIKACHDIARLVGFLEARGSIDYEDLSLRVEHIIASLGSSIIESDINGNLEGLTVSQISRLLYVAQCTRYAAFVFLHSAVERAIEICGFEDTECIFLRQKIPYTRVQALDGCLGMLADIQISKHCEFAGLALALFLAGCEVEDEHKRYTVMEKLFAISHNFGLCHISRARDALMLIWQPEKGAEPKAWWSVMREKGWELILC